MRIALVSEGTYPFAVGGVSTWCDQLIRGLPDHRWTMVALTEGRDERFLWKSPDNLDDVLRIPLWTPHSGGGSRRPGSGLASSYDGLLQAMLTQQDPRSAQAMVARSRFLLALRGIYEYASAGGDLATELTSNAGVAQLVTAWRQIRQTDLSLANALEVANLLSHMLRPLTVPAVSADIVHSSMNGLSMLVAMAAKWRHGTHVVMSEHGIYLRERYLDYLETNAPLAVKAMMLSFFRTLAGAGYLIADAIAPHSSYNRRWQLLNGADPDRMWTMYNGVEPKDFPAANTEPDQPTIVFMGRISPLKDLHTLIRAFTFVHTRLSTARLRIFGSIAPTDAAYAQTCQRLIKDLGLAGAVTLEGAVDSPVAAYHAATVVALTSVSEGFPMALVEAMACGRPVVCTNVGGVPEAVADAGIVVAPRDPFAVAQACITVLTNHELRQRMAAAARSRVLELFTLGQSLEAYRGIYDHLDQHSAAQRPALPQKVHPLALSLPQHTSRRGRRPRALGCVQIKVGDRR